MAVEVKKTEQAWPRTSVNTAKAVGRFVNTTGDVRWSLNMPVAVKNSVNSWTRLRTPRGLLT